MKPGNAEVEVDLDKVIAEGGKLLDRTECACGAREVAANATRGCTAVCPHGLCWHCDDCPCMDEGADA